MWKTARGTRKLQGKERHLFAYGLLSLHEAVRDYPEFSLTPGDTAFDLLPKEERPDLLLMAGRSVLDSRLAPPLVAWNASAVHAVYRHVRQELEIETVVQHEEGTIHGQHPTWWRRLVDEAWRERRKGDSARSSGTVRLSEQELGSDDVELWNSKIDFLEAEVKHDEASLMEYPSEFPWDKLPPERELLSVAASYLLAIPPLLTAPQQRELRTFRLNLCRELDQGAPAQRRTGASGCSDTRRTGSPKN